MTEPILRRRFQMTSLKDNHNKYWQVEFYADGRMITEFGRVGVVNPPSVKTGQSMTDVNRIIREKERKGYVEVKLHVVEVVTKKAGKKAVNIDPAVQGLIDLIMVEAGKKQKEYLKVGIEELHQDQIDDARKVLTKISEMLEIHKRSPTYDIKDFATLVQLYYTLIPTKLPAKISENAIVGDFLGEIGEQDQRLNQLSAGLAGYKRRVVQEESGLALLGGTKIELCEVPSRDHQLIYDMIRNTQGCNPYRTVNVFKVEMPNERQRYDDNDFGKSREQLCFHGTNNYNLQFILSEENGCGGLIVPKIHSHGRFYGDGLYFADRAQKSLNYTHTTTGLVTLLVCKVALGKAQIQDGQCYHRTKCDPGYDSLISKYTPSGLNELLVYRNEQATVSYIATLK